MDCGEIPAAGVAMFFLLWCALACSTKAAPNAKNDDPPKRLITLTPSLTEIVIALGATDRLVAVDKYSRALPNIGSLPIAGDFVAPNVEVISKLAPDLVLLDQAQAAKTQAALHSGGFRTMSIKMHTVADIKTALTSVADALALGERGSEAAAKIDQALAREKRTLEKPIRVLWVIDRNPGALSNIIAAGPSTFADEVMGSVGATNVLIDPRVRYPKISREALERLDVDLLFDSSGAAQASIAAWKSAKHIRKVVALETSLASPTPSVAATLTTLGGHVSDAVEVERAANSSNPPSTPITSPR